MKKVVAYINTYAKQMGTQLVYAGMLLYYAYGQKDTPAWAKSTIIGAIAYLLSPIDSIPDLTPFLGFTDDMGVVMFGLVAIACYIDEEVRTAARAAVTKIVKNPDLILLDEVDRRL